MNKPLFKYRTVKNGETILKNQSIRVSRAEDFNDPFELSPVIDPASFTPEKLRMMLLHAHVIDKYFEDETIPGQIPKSEYERWYRDPKQLDERVAMQLKKVERNTAFVQQEFRPIFDDHNRLFCGSRIKNSILMWSHYSAAQILFCKFGKFQTEGRFWFCMLR